MFDTNGLRRALRVWAAVTCLLGVACVALVGYLVVGCAAPPPPPPVTPAPVLTPSCTTACANLERLGCPEARPTKGGLACVTICERASQIQDMRLGCVSSASNFTALLACETVRCTK